MVGTALAVSAQDLSKYRFGSGVYDYYGHIAWRDLGSVSEPCQKALQLMKANHFVEAAAGFRAELKRNANEPSALQGLAECMRKLGRLPQLYEEVSVQLLTSRKQDKKAKPELVIYYQYLLSMIAFEREMNSPSIKKLNEMDIATAGGQAFQFSEAPVDWKKLDRPFWVMYISSLGSRGLNLAARSTAQEMLALKPGFYQIRLLYAIELNRGTVARSADGKNWQEAPESMRSQPKEALRQALEVLRVAPEWLPGIYVAAASAYSSDKALSKKLFGLYLQKAEPNSPRAEAARDLLRKLG